MTTRDNLMRKLEELNQKAKVGKSAISKLADAEALKILKKPILELMKQKNTLNIDDAVTIISTYMDNFEKDETDIDFMRQILKELLFAVDVDQLYAKVNQAKENQLIPME